MDLGIAGKRAAVAAASSGLGLASAKALAAEGVHVAICGRDRGTRRGGCCAKSATTASASSPTSAMPPAARRSSPRRPRRSAASTSSSPTPVGRRRATSRAPTSTPTPTPSPSTCCRSSGCARRRCRRCRSDGWGRVVAITSIAVRQPIAELILSNTARAGVTGFLKTIARELAGSGVTVNSVQPGLHRTPRIVELYGADPPGPARRTGRLRRHRRLRLQRAGDVPHRRRDPRRRRQLRRSAVGELSDSSIGGTYSPTSSRRHHAFVRRRSSCDVNRYSNTLART